VFAACCYAWHYSSRISLAKYYFNNESSHLKRSPFWRKAHYSGNIVVCCVLCTGSSFPWGHH